MQRADLERKRAKTANTALRAALTKQIENITTEEQGVNENLRALSERAERLAKLADTLRALARDGNVTVMQQLTDRRAALVDTLAISYEIEIAKMAADQNRAQAIAKNLAAYEKLSAAEKLAEHTRLKNIVQTAYTSLTQQVAALKQEFTTVIMGSVVDDVLAEERAKYITAMEAAVTDAAERTAQAAAIDVVIAEKKAIYREKLQGILNSSFAQIEAISGVIREQLKLPPASTAYVPTVHQQTALQGSILMAGFLEDFQQSFGKSLQSQMDTLLTGYVPKVQKLSADALSLHASHESVLITIIGSAEKEKQLYALTEAGNMKAFQQGLQALEKPVQDRITSAFKKVQADARADHVATLTKNGGKFTPAISITRQNTAAACAARTVLSAQKNLCDSLLQLIGEAGFNSTTVKLLDIFEKSELLRKNSTSIAAFVQKEVTWYKAEIQKPKTLLRGAKAAEVKWLLIQKIIATPSIALSGGTPKEIAARKKDLAQYQAYRTKLIAGEAKNWLSAHPVCGATQTSWFQSLKAIPGAVVITGECRDVPWAQLMREYGLTAKKGTKVPAPVVTYVDGFEVTTDVVYGTAIRKKNSRTESVAVNNRAGLPVLIIDTAGFVTALTYDAGNRLIERKKALLAIDSRANAWDGEWFFRNQPELAERVTWSYRTNGEIHERQEFDGLTAKLGKAIRYLYLDENVGTLIPEVQAEVRRDTAYAGHQLAQITVSDGSGVRTMENTFLYNKYLQMLAIQSVSALATKNIFLFPDDLVHRTYPALVKNSSVDGSSKHNFSIDHEGNVWNAQQKLLSGNWPSTLVAVVDDSWLGMIPEYRNETIAMDVNIALDEPAMCTNGPSFNFGNVIKKIENYAGFRQFKAVRIRECNWGKTGTGKKHDMYILDTRRRMHVGLSGCPKSWAKNAILSTALGGSFDETLPNRATLKEIDVVFKGKDLTAMLTAKSEHSPFLHLTEEEPDVKDKVTVAYGIRTTDENLVYAAEQPKGEWLLPYVIFPFEMQTFLIDFNKHASETGIFNYFGGADEIQLGGVARPVITESAFRKMSRQSQKKACY